MQNSHYQRRRQIKHPYISIEGIFRSIKGTFRSIEGIFHGIEVISYIRLLVSFDKTACGPAELLPLLALTLKSLVILIQLYSLSIVCLFGRK